MNATAPTPWIMASNVKRPTPRSSWPIRSKSRLNSTNAAVRSTGKNELPAPVDGAEQHEQQAGQRAADQTTGSAE